MSEIPRKKVTLDEQKASNSEILESISKAESMSPSSFDSSYRAKESQVRTKSKECATKDNKETHKAKVLPRNQDSKSSTNDGVWSHQKKPRVA